MVHFVAETCIYSGKFNLLISQLSSEHSRCGSPPNRLFVCVATYTHICICTCVYVCFKPSKGLTNELFHTHLIVTLADSNVPSLTVFLLNKHIIYIYLLYIILTYSCQASFITSVIIMVRNSQKISGRVPSPRQQKTPQDRPCNPRTWTCDRCTDRTRRVHESPPGPTSHCGWFPAYLKEEIVKTKNTP